METVILRVSQIEPDRKQPRKYFNEQSLYDLADSILQYGVIEPIIVTYMPNGFYKIVAGERRWRASRIAQLREIPAIVKDDISELDAFKISFSENLQRQSLTPIEEAMGFVRLKEEFNLTQDEISKATGRSRSSIANIIRLLKLPDSVKIMLEDGTLSIAHAKQILSVDEEYQEDLAKKTIELGLSVKQLEAEVKKLKSNPVERTPKRIDTYYTETEISLKDILNRPVKITGSNKKGTITLEFYGKDDLNSIANVLAKLLDK